MNRLGSLFFVSLLYIYIFVLIFPVAAWAAENNDMIEQTEENKKEAIMPADEKIQKRYEMLLKKGKNRAQVLIIQNNTLQLPMSIDHTVACITKTTLPQIMTFGKTPNNAFKKWMKACDFTASAQSIENQKRKEKKLQIQQTVHEYHAIKTPPSIIDEILNPEHFDQETKTILGNTSIPKHNIIEQQTEELKILGISELIGVGISSYKGSSANRKKNFMNAAQKFDGQIVHPGESFSVIGALSPFTHENGYTEGKVIKETKEGETDEEMGGGVCQSVTTLFRAWHNAGLEVSNTKPHSKVIGYYGGIGLDATIYEANTPKYNVDLLLKNDSQHSVLIQSIDRNGYQAMLIYGTKEKSVALKRTSFEKTPTGQVAKWEKKTTNIYSGETKNFSFVQKQTRNEK